MYQRDGHNETFTPMIRTSNFVGSERAKKFWAAESAPDIAESGMPCPVTGVYRCDEGHFIAIQRCERTVKEPDIY
jgi:hypothetical protein